MFKKFLLHLVSVISLFLAVTIQAQHQVLTLKAAVDSAVANYGTIKAKVEYIKASRSSLTQSRREYLPDLNLSAQQDYGTINGQVGPLYGFRGLSASSAGPPLPTQNWNSAFGALYLANIEWNFFSFGRVRERINLAKFELERDENDLEQEVFQHKIRVAAAYLNLLAAQRLSGSWQNNLARASGLRDVVVTRTRNGLNAGVDSSLANAEVSSAKIALVRARDFEQEQSNQLAIFMGTTKQEFLLDSIFLNRIPTSISDLAGRKITDHPTLRFNRSLVSLSSGQERFLRTFYYPTFSLFGIIQTRGSGFRYNYGDQYPDAFTGKYLEGVAPRRANYVTGIGMIWNITSSLRLQQQIASQRFTSKGLQFEYELVDQQLKNQLLLAERKIQNAMENYQEAPVQVKAAGDAYNQKSVLYKNGLSTIIDITQALYTVNRAETDRDIAFSNVWQALLLKAAALGDFGYFINEF
ncbi:MAG: TolC family protein [Chitinophagaceae bacterium]